MKLAADQINEVQSQRTVFDIFFVFLLREEIIYGITGLNFGDQPPDFYPDAAGYERAAFDMFIRIFKNRQSIVDNIGFDSTEPTCGEA